jgi:hypothetical protein
MIRYLALLSFALLPLQVLAQDAPVAPVNVPPPVVLELFTSQGCGFCPPADKLMGQMIEQQSVIGLSCHVDYFNIRNNSLGKGFCTKRQNDYNRLIGTGPRYTPQLVVNGHMDMIGYEAGKVSAAILKGRAEKLLPIPLTVVAEDSYSFSLPEINLKNEPVKLWLAVFDKPRSFNITEGNNLGKKMTYYNVVSRMEDLGAWDGKPLARAINANYSPVNGGIAILAQNTATGHIIAAGSVNRTSP